MTENPTSQQQIKINPLIKGIMDENNPLMLEILNHLIYLSTRFRYVFISQGTLAAKFGATVRWINTLLARWKSLGVIQYRQQGFNRSCIYRINPILAQERERLKWQLPALKLVLCISSLISIFRGEFLLSNIRNYIFIDQSIHQSIFLKNQSSNTSIYEQHLQKERIMNEKRPIINQIKDQFRIPDEEMSFFTKYSDIVLQDSIDSYAKSAQGKDIKYPVGYFRRVVGTVQERHERKAEKGMRTAHSSKASNPRGHSPAAEVPNLTHIEHIEYLMKEIVKFSKTFDHDKSYSQDASMNEYLKKIAMNSITGMQREVDQLISLLDDPSHSCKEGCIDKSQFLRMPKQQDCTPPAGDEDYEGHLNQISADKSNPEAYKLMVRKYDYRRIAR